LRVHQILEGTNEIMRVIIAREILKENKWALKKSFLKKKVL
jgi:hypothetical protein